MQIINSVELPGGGGGGEGDVKKRGGEQGGGHSPHSPTNHRLPVTWNLLRLADAVTGEFNLNNVVKQPSLTLENPNYNPRTALNNPRNYRTYLTVFSYLCAIQHH